MKIRLRERDLQTRRWQTVLDQRVHLTSCTRVIPLALNESSELSLFLFPERGDAVDFDARILIGNFPVASTLEKDRPDFPIRLASEGDDGTEYYVCSGRLLRDWVGETELHVEVLDRSQSGHAPQPEPEPEPEDEFSGTMPAEVHREHWVAILSADLRISAGKLEQEAFEVLCAEIADYSAGMLLDVFGKTFINLELERRPGENAPILVLQRVRHVINQMGESLRAIARRPAYRLKSRRVREPALAEMAVSDLTLEETCLDPTLAVPLQNGSVHFLEHVREVASPSYDLPENRMIAGFLHFLSLQVRDLRRRMEHEIEMREARREYRHRRSGVGTKTWWESEDLPRIEEMRSLLSIVSTMGRDLADLLASPFLPPTPPLRNVPPSTPLVRYHKAYSSAFKTIVAHFQAFRVQVDDKHLVMRARSLPVLYEWWCLLEVMRILRGCLPFSAGEDLGPGSPFRRLAEERDRFVVEFEPDQAVDFEDPEGRLVRVRYVPSYRNVVGARGSAYGFLGEERERTPDIAVEVFPSVEAVNEPPELIIVFDAKYSSESHGVKLDEVSRKYGKIGVFQTGRVLSRQVWALTPMPAASSSVRAALNAPEWASFCTVDNLGIWSDDFDMTSAVAGVVQAKPKMPAGRPPLDTLLRLLLRRAGVVLQG
jgi:Domain of unknown function (DUF2357)/PD-(D/E)XK nuclease superfamily